MILPLLLTLVAGPADSILGRWEGTSTCIKAPWNAACHDEVVRYDFVRAPGRGDTITVHAFKQAQGAWDWMGDIDFGYDSAGHRWVGDFSNTRVHIEWSYWLASTELHGQVVSLPDRRKARDVTAHRVAVL